jgi:mono/diheme cytochrome c family protein
MRGDSVFARFDRSFQTDARAEPARPEGGTASGALRRCGVVLLLAVALAGCGGGGNSSHGTGGRSGLAVFESAGCGKCHTLAAAGAHGTVGPDLDRLRPAYDRVLRQVEKGGGGMPSFRGDLSPRQIRAVALFVAGGTAKRQLSVAAAFKPDHRTVESCGRDATCLQQAFANLAYHRGPKVALALFTHAMQTKPFVEENCHRIAHAIGAGALTRFHGEVGPAFAAGSAVCWSGYYHGILERAFQGVPNARLGRVARRLCTRVEAEASVFVAYQCVHGLGHGLMIYTGYDLPLALRTCDGLSTPWEQTSCTGGVFMENQSSSYGFKSRWLRPKQPLYPCTTVAERHKLYCYLMVTSQILPDVGYSWSKTVHVCRRSEARWVATCFQSLGRDASGQTRGRVAQIERICGLAGDMERECLLGAAKDLTSNDANGRRAARLCASAEATARAYCFYGIGSILGTFTADPARRAARCRALTSSRACVDGANGRPFRS